MSSPTVLQVVQEAMGKAGVLSYTEVAERAGLHVRTVSGANEKTTVETLRKIFDGLGSDLVIGGKRRTAP